MILMTTLSPQNHLVFLLWSGLLFSVFCYLLVGIRLSEPQNPLIFSQYMNVFLALILLSVVKSTS